VGYSLGARLALGILLRHPELCSRATLIGVNPGFEDEDSRRERRAGDERWARLLETEGMSGFIPAWESRELFASQRALPTAVRESERARRLRHDPRRLAQTLRKLGLAEMPNYWSRLTEIKIPVTLLVGDHDQKFYAIARRMAALLPCVELCVVENAGHNLLLEKPESVAAVLNGRSTNG
jgi:2-succinyl-6-hydroxy-2,4-cyclohexadiene-1-carboxylate synthase